MLYTNLSNSKVMEQRFTAEPIIMGAMLPNR